MELRTLFRRLRIDIVHTHNPKPGLYGRVAARSAGVPVVVNTVHGLYAVAEDRLAKRAAVYGLERLAAACSHAELVQNPEDLETLRRLRVPAERLHLLGNGIDLERFDPDAIDASRRAQTRGRLGVRPDEVLCGVVGRLVWAKGYREVYEAARQLRDTVPYVRFVIIGPYDTKADAITTDEVARAERETGVMHLGLRDDMEDLYAALDVFVLASHREGFPRAAMEAAAMGRPVIATNVRGGRQVVDDCVTGRLVPVGEAQLLAAAIAELARDESQRLRMGAAGRTKARRDFDEQRVIRKTLDVYDDLLRRAYDKAPAA
ncbi:MAG: glycosyltransferase family 4 protein [Actinobacteria bacterium]|nr:glycosyltransferase family 4 protein [Actinomycetota bacterium]